MIVHVLPPSAKRLRTPGAKRKRNYLRKQWYRKMEALQRQLIRITPRATHPTLCRILPNWRRHENASHLVIESLTIYTIHRLETCSRAKWRFHSLMATSYAVHRLLAYEYCIIIYERRYCGPGRVRYLTLYTFKLFCFYGVAYVGVNSVLNSNNSALYSSPLMKWLTKICIKAKFKQGNTQSHCFPW